AVDLVRARAIDGGELLLDLVGLADVALVELVVLFHRSGRDPVQLTNAGKRLRGELGERHGVLLCVGRTAGSNPPAVSAGMRTSRLAPARTRVNRSKCLGESPRR